MPALRLRPHSGKEEGRPMNTHPTLPEFDYLRPRTLAEASEFLSRHAGEARPFLGGTDILVRMRDGFLTPRFLVDIKGLDGANDLHFDPRTGLRLGAAASMNRVIASSDVQEHYPLLAEACRSVASYPLRTRATIVGNLCNASPAGDTIGACLVLDGVLQVHGLQGPRQEGLESFFLGPGKTMLEPGDVVTAIHFPLPPEGCEGVYLKLGRNQLSDLSIVGVTALGHPDSSCPSGYRFRLALASVAPVPLMPVEAEGYLASHSITSESLIEAAQMAAEACSPIDDVRGSAHYRKLMVRNLTAAALAEVWRRLTG
jgi:CO/xanthine dehydrogenase FAD-binding subunit